ncbi:MAG: DUF4738 domain-containing protein [Bacteroidaceae bacterium]|nr:DUF4738 domain-containing protein [Bacteroidaceae bacterium]
MKKHTWMTGCLLTALAIGACKGQQSPSVEATAPGEYMIECTYGDGIQRMMPYDYSDTLAIGAHRYAYSIHREAADSLPTVKDDDGTVYADNAYHLIVRRDGKQLLDRHFTKRSFARYLSADMREKGILDGMMRDGALPGLAFAISVSLPQSDMLEPLLLKVDATGGISIERDQRSENDFEDE